MMNNTGSKILGSSKGDSIQTIAEYDGHFMHISIHDKNHGTIGFIGIHSTNLGPALGGTRYKPYISEKSALKDVLNLSKAMSYKCAMAGLPYGGGKGVLIEKPGVDRKIILAQYAKAVHELRGLFRTGTDVGVSDQDVQYMSKYTDKMLGVGPADRGDMSTSSIAALGVYNALRASLKHKYGSDNPSGVKISIKGVGKLGGELAKLLHNDGAILTIADVDTEKCLVLSQELDGLTIVSPDEIHKIPTQVFAPCALGNEITPNIILDLNVDIIVGGANNQLVDEGLGLALVKKNILYAPDYIANAGGLIYVADELELDGFNRFRVLERAESIKDTLTEVFIRANDEKLPTNIVAKRIAEDKIGSIDI